MKLLIDFFPIILFFVAFKVWGIYTATAVAIVATIAQIAYLRIKTGKIEPMQWMSLGVIVLFGGATLLAHDDNFIKWKPTVLYWLFGAVLVGARIFTGRNLMQKLMGEKVSMPAAVWDKLNYSWATFFIISGLLNLYVAFSGHFTESQWVNFKVFGLMALLIAFVIAQSVWLGRHINEHDSDAS